MGRIERRLLLQTRVGQLGSLLSLLLVVVFGAIWLGKSRDPVYGAFALAALFYGINSLDHHMQEVPFPYWGAKWIQNWALTLHAVFFAILVHRLLGRRPLRLERALLLVGLSDGLLTAVWPARTHPGVTDAFFGVAVAIGIYCFARFVVDRARIPRRELAIYLAIGAAMLGIGARDLGIEVGVLPADSLRGLPFHGPLLVLGFGSALLLRFLAAYRRAERANVELEERIHEKETELERNFGRLRELERERAVASERERIMREMHDGMGAQLVSALALVEDRDARPGDVAAALESALDDMRLVIDSLDPVADDLPTLLGMLRRRVEPRLRRSGLRFDWRVSALPPSAFSPEQLLHILRIVQEALTNIVRHARARVVTISTGEGEADGGVAGVFVRVADDGLGIDPARPAGRGLRNMAHRAAQLGGRLDRRSNGDGTVIELWVPLATGR